MGWVDPMNSLLVLPQEQFNQLAVKFPLTGPQYALKEQKLWFF